MNVPPKDRNKVSYLNSQSRIDVSINVIFHNIRFLAWCASQLYKVISYSNKQGITTELIIVSECDQKLFEHYPKHKYIRCKEKEHIGVKRNMALEASRGRFICCFDSDDWFPKYRIKLCLELFEQLPSDVLAITTNRIFTYDIINKRSYYINCESESALFFKRALWKLKGKRFGTEGVKGEGNALINGGDVKLYIQNEYMMIIALRHSENTTTVPETKKDLGPIDEFLNDEEKYLLNHIL